MDFLKKATHLQKLWITRLNYSCLSASPHPPTEHSSGGAQLWQNAVKVMATHARNKLDLGDRSVMRGRGQREVTLCADSPRGHQEANRRLMKSLILL